MLKGKYVSRRQGGYSVNYGRFGGGHKRNAALKIFGASTEATVYKYLRRKAAAAYLFSLGGLSARADRVSRTLPLSLGATSSLKFSFFLWGERVRPEVVRRRAAGREGIGDDKPFYFHFAI